MSKIIRDHWKSRILTHDEDSENACHSVYELGLLQAVTHVARFSAIGVFFRFSARSLVYILMSLFGPLQAFKYAHK